MQHLKHHDENIVKWLIEPRNPSVRYWTLLHLMGKSPLAKDVMQTQNEIMQSDCVRKILSKQEAKQY